MLFSLFALSLVAAALSAPPPTTTTTIQPQNESDQNYPVPQIDWGKCPQLKPTEADKEQKRLVIQKCLEQNPPPALETVTDPKQIDDHRELVTTCALNTEGWFNEDGSYKFERAKTEIESKKLDSQVEKNISTRHEECKDEAVKRFPKGYIQQVQLYQACMDYHIAEICEIELIPPPGGFPLEEFADYDEVPAQPDQPQSSTAQPQAQPTVTTSK